MYKCAWSPYTVNAGCPLKSLWDVHGLLHSLNGESLSLFKETAVLPIFRMINTFSLVSLHVSSLLGVLSSVPEYTINEWIFLGSTDPSACCGCSIWHWCEMLVLGLWPVARMQSSPRSCCFDAMTMSTRPAFFLYTEL